MTEIAYTLLLHKSWYIALLSGCQFCGGGITGIVTPVLHVLRWRDTGSEWSPRWAAWYKSVLGLLFVHVVACGLRVGVLLRLKVHCHQWP